MNEQRLSPEEFCARHPEYAARLRRAEWKRRQALRPKRGTPVAPPMSARINRLPPGERYELRMIVRSLYLRKAIRRTLLEAFHGNRISRLMQKSSETEQSPMPSTPHDRSSMPFSNSQATEYTHVTYGPGLDPPAVTRALERAMRCVMKTTEER